MTDLRPLPRPERRRCTADGAHCIHAESFVADTCAAIATASQLHGLDPHFLARLIWRESRFDPNAVSPAGAQGIAQFMPGTAALRGLDDPFNPAAAIFASAAYLSDLTRRFGNPGRAAIAYNAGEARARRYLAAPAAVLPAETRAYVPAITGLSADVWRTEDTPDADFRLSGDAPFLDACTTLAAARAIREFRPPAPPWGVIVAAGRRRATVEIFAAKVRAENAAILGDAEIAIVPAAMAGFGLRARHTALVATGSRSAAQDLCRRLRRNGAFCQVNRR